MVEAGAAAALTFDSSTWKAEAGRALNSGQSRPWSKFQDGQRATEKPCLEKSNK